MRTHVAGSASALLALLLAGAGAGAQQATPAATGSGTLNGVVTDSLSGLPVVDAAVSLEAGVVVLTDRQGRFEFRNAPKEGQVSVSVDQLGYAPWFRMTDVATPSLAVKLAPDSAVIRGLKTIEAQVRSEIGLMANVRYFGRRDLLKDRASDLRSFLQRRGVYAPVQAPYPRGPDNVLGMGQAGVQVNPYVFIDGSGFVGYAALPNYRLDELYAIVVANGGAQVVVWTAAYIERLARAEGR